MDHILQGHHEVIKILHMCKWSMYVHFITSLTASVNFGKKILINMKHTKLYNSLRTSVKNKYMIFIIHEHGSQIMNVSFRVNTLNDTTIYLFVSGPRVPSTRASQSALFWRVWVQCVSQALGLLHVQPPGEGHGAAAGRSAQHRGPAQGEEGQVEDLQAVEDTLLHAIRGGYHVQQDRTGRIYCRNWWEELIVIPWWERVWRM